jgi:hypothetical protein
MNRRIGASIVLALVLTAAAGCEEPETAPEEPKRPVDKLAAADIESFLAIVDGLPDHELPAVPPVNLPAPQWGSSRTLPVNELVAEERKLLVERSSLDWLIEHWPPSRPLNRALRRERLTIPQLVGLYLTIGTALSRDSLPLDRDLEDILIHGNRALEELKKDKRMFSSLSEDSAFALQEQAAWLTIVDRATRLKEVPTENVALVHEYRDKLNAHFPEEFLRNPFAEFAKLIDDQGIPFQEPVGESDENISWSRATAIIGSDERPAAPPPADAVVQPGM